MKLTTNRILIFFGIIALAMMACLPVTIFAMPLLGPKVSSQPDSQATLQAMITQTLGATTQTAPTATPTLSLPTFVPATSTPIPPTNTPPPTSTAVVYCDWVMFLKDVTIPDGSKMGPGEVFTKTWRLQNRGTCTWTSDYYLVFVNGSQMGPTTSVRLPGRVAPGQTVDVSVTLTAPNSLGRQVGYWMLRNPSGALFGYGNNAEKAFYVDIKVTKEVLPHGEVTGSLCYPSEFNPPMTLYFENAATREVIQYSIPEAQNYYSALLPNGNYYVWAWAPDYNLEGAFTDSSGLMITFPIYPGETTYNIDLCDWSPYPHGRVGLP
ncbi:MAG TPA: NBR1-Ig-like domain-containing protein [Anaerolineales bacterium]|nr:NBR1-Ig-like domain-containing protein [Anaerolineales bacterium]